MKKTSIRSRAPSASSPKVRKVMQANVGRETTAEIGLRRALHATGLRFRKDYKLEPDFRWKADVVFPRAKVCVFVDGCFWHGCKRHFNVPKTNSAWWDEKIQANIARDRLQKINLQVRGWKVVRIWEHQIVGTKTIKIAKHLEELIRK